MRRNSHLAAGLRRQHRFNELSHTGGASGWRSDGATPPWTHECALRQPRSRAVCCHFLATSAARRAHRQTHLRPSFARTCRLAMGNAASAPGPSDRSAAQQQGQRPGTRPAYAPQPYAPTPYFPQARGPLVALASPKEKAQPGPVSGLATRTPTHLRCQSLAVHVTARLSLTRPTLRLLATCPKPTALIHPARRSAPRRPAHQRRPVRLLPARGGAIPPVPAGVCQPAARA